MRIAAPDFREELHAADARHMEVGDDRVKSLALQSHKRFFTTAGSGATESRRAQDDREKLASSGIVVDDEHASSRLAIR